MFQIQIPSLDLPLFANSLVVLVILVLLYRKILVQNDLKLPPGPRKLPLIGNLHRLAWVALTAAEVRLPHHSLRNLAKKYGPIMHLKLGQVSSIVISSPELAEEVLKTHASAFAGRPSVLATEITSYNQSGIASSPYNDYWRKIRKVCVLELLSAKRVQSFASIREDEAWNLVQSVYSLSQPQGHEHGRPVILDLSEMIFSAVNSITARAAFGRKCKYQHEFTSVVKELNLLATGLDLPDLFPSLRFLHYVTSSKSAIEKIHRKLDRILEEIIDDHKLKRPTMAATSNDASADADHLQEDEDLVDVLLQLQESGELQFDLTSNNIKSVTQDIYSAGSDTSAMTIEWAMSELLRNPRAMEKAQAEIRQLGVAGKKKIQDADIKKLDYMKLVVKETLRLHPPLALIPRQANETRKVSGYDIPSGTKVLINAWAIGRDPKHWGDNADCFEPERFRGSSIDFRGTNFEFLPFGAGKRICPGIGFGTATVELVLSQLLYSLNWKLPKGAEPHELDMTEAKGFSNRKKNELKVIATPFIPSTI